MSVSSSCCCSVRSIFGGGGGVAVMVLLKHCAIRSRSWGSEYGAVERSRRPLAREVEPALT
eukprot:1826674-Prorocentrum_lima.AAC.1